VQPAVGDPASAGGLDEMTHRGPFQPQTFCDSGVFLTTAFKEEWRSRAEDQVLLNLRKACVLSRDMSFHIHRNCLVLSVQWSASNTRTSANLFLFGIRIIFKLLKWHNFSFYAIIESIQNQSTIF